MLSKRCVDCGGVKASKDGLAYCCKICFGLRNSRSYRKKQAERGKETRPYRRHSDVPEGMKHCAQCKETKPVEEFGRNRSRASGVATCCRPCHNRVIAENKGRNHGSGRNYLLKLRYGISEEQVARMIAEQGGICVICLRAEPKRVDHDHMTGLVRRILCFKCNGGLGQFDDAPSASGLRRTTWNCEVHARRMRIEIGAPAFGGPDRVRWDPYWRTRGNATRPARHYHLRQKYGIDDEDTEWLLKLQMGHCAVCFDFPPSMSTTTTSRERYVAWRVRDATRAWGS